MEKFCVSPLRSAYILRMRTHMEWMVLTHMRRVSAMAERRSFISFAALLVKVMARIFSGGTPISPTRWAMRAVKTRVLPLPAPASTRTAPSVVSTGSRCSSFRSKTFMEDIISYPPRFDKRLDAAQTSIGNRSRKRQASPAAERLGAKPTRFRPPPAHPCGFACFLLSNCSSRLKRSSAFKYFSESSKV